MSEIDRQQLQLNSDRVLRQNTWAMTGDGAFFSLGSAFLEANTILPAFVSTLTASAVLVGLVSTIRSMGYFLPQIFVAAFIERQPLKKPFMMRAGVIMRLAALGIAVSALLAGANPDASLVVFMVSLVVLSFSDGFGSLPWMDIVAKMIPSHRRAGLFGRMQSIGGFLAFCAGFLIEFLLRRALPYPFNYAVVFTMGFFFLTLSLIAMGFIVEHEGPVRDDFSTVFEYLKRLPRVWNESKLFRQVIGARVLLGSIYLGLPFLALHAVEGLGFSRSVVGLFVSAQMVGSVVGGPLWGYLGDNHGSYVVIRLVSAMAACSGLMALGARFLHSVGLDSLVYALYFLLYAFLGASFGGTWIGFSNYVMDISPEESRATYIGLLNTVAAPLTLLAVAGGWLLDRAGYVQLFAAMTLVLCAAAVTAFRLPDSRRYRN